MSLAIGVAAARVVDAHVGAARAEVKWPNDVLVAGKKVAGVLVEGQIRGDVVGHVVVGVLTGLLESGQVDSGAVDDAIKRYDIDPDAAEPFFV